MRAPKAIAIGASPDSSEVTLARLIVAAGKRAGDAVELGEATLSVGRLASCELPIEEPQASRKHFEVARRDGQTWLKDLGSRNGTFVNDERVEGETKLEDGDRIRVGTTVILYEAAGAPLGPGTRLGPYEITAVAERRKGLTVHEARHAALDRTVLVDVLDAGDAQAARFLARARQGSAFDHPALLAIYDAGEHEGRAYRVREVLVDARDLEARLREGQLEPELAVEVARQVAEGLAHIHSKQAIHGRLTPRVILVDDREVAKVELVGDDPRERLDPERRDARLQALSASPEEARGLEANAASDVYALGCVLFRMLAGVPPFDGEFPAIVRGHASDQPAPSILDHEPDLPPELAELLASMLAKRPADRPTAEGVAATLAGLASGSGVEEAPAPPPPPPRPKPRTESARPAARVSAAAAALPPPRERKSAVVAAPAPATLDTKDPDDTDDEGPAPPPAPRIRDARAFDPVRAALLGALYFLLFLLSSEGTRLVLRLMQK